MLLVPSVYVLPGAVATVLCAAFALVMARRPRTPGIEPFRLLLVSGAIWSGCQVIDACLASFAAKRVVAGVQYVGIVGVPLSYLAFALAHCHGIRAARHPRALVLLCLVPSISVALALTSTWHSLLWSELRVVAGLPLRVVRYGPWFAVHSTYLYALSGAGMLVVLAQALRSPKNAARLFLLWIAPLCVAIANGLWLSGLLSLPLDPTPVGLAAGAIFTGISVFRLRLLDTTPVPPAVLLDALCDPVVAIDAARRIAHINQAAATWLGRPASEALGRSASDVLPAELQSLASRESEATVEISLSLSGEDRIFEARVSELPGERAGRLLALRDITARKQAELTLSGTRRELEAANEMLTRLALTDSLTGAATRAHFLSQLQRDVRRHQRSGEPLSLLMIDLDHFKRVNDLHGHPVGDEVLAAVGEVLLDRRRASDVVGRLGGEEFALLLCGNDRVGARRVAARIHAGIRSLVFSADGVQLRVTTSIGITQLSSQHADERALIAAADGALYAAKDAGRDCSREA